MHAPKYKTLLFKRKSFDPFCEGAENSSYIQAI